MYSDQKVLILALTWSRIYCFSVLDWPTRQNVEAIALYSNYTDTHRVYSNLFPPPAPPIMRLLQPVRQTKLHKTPAHWPVSLHITHC